MKKIYKYIIPLFLIFFSFYAYAETSSSSINCLSKQHADTLYCGINDCGNGTSGGGNATFENVNYIDFNITWNGSGQEGRLFWNSDDGTLQVGMPGGDVNLQLGQETLIRVKASEDIDNGEFVYIDGAVGANPTVSLAIANDEDIAHATLAMATESISSGQFGYVTTFGLVRDLDTSMASAGDIIYLSASTPGAYTITEPSYPDYSVTVGYVIWDHATEGTVFVNIHPDIWKTALSSNVLNDTYVRLYSEEQQNITSKIKVTDTIQADKGVNFDFVEGATASTANLINEVGNIDACNHRYMVTFVTDIGETAWKTWSNTVTTDASNGKINVTNIPISTDYRVTARKLYRTICGSAAYQLYYAQLVTTINDITTTDYLDNTADADLGYTGSYPGAYYRPDTTNSVISLEGTQAINLNNWNSFIGLESGSSWTYGTANVGYGQYVFRDLTAGSSNTATGHIAGRGITTGTGNTITGGTCGYRITTGNYNSLYGLYSGYTYTTQTGNSCYGYGTCRNNVGSYNNMFGYRAGFNEVGSYRLYIDSSDTSTPLIYGEMDNRLLRFGEDGTDVCVGTANDLCYSFDGTNAQFELPFGDYVFNTGDITLDSDNQKIIFGANGYSSIYYNDSNMIINPRETGNGNLIIGDGTNNLALIIKGDAGATIENITFNINPTGDAVISASSGQFIFNDNLKLDDNIRLIYGGSNNFFETYSTTSGSLKLFDGFGFNTLREVKDLGTTADFKYYGNMTVSGYINATEGYINNSLICTQATGCGGSSYIHPENITLTKINTTQSLSYIEFLQNENILLSPISGEDKNESFSLINISILQDTYISSIAPSVSYGSSASLWSVNGSNGALDILIQVNNTIPEDGYLESATCYLWLYDNNIAGGTFDISTVSYLYEWSDSTLKWDNHQQQGTQYFSNQTFDGSEIGLIEFDVTEVVQNCYDNNYNTNCTIYFQGNSYTGAITTADNIRFDSTEGDQLPYCNLDYLQVVNESASQVEVIGDINQSVGDAFINMVYGEFYGHDTCEASIVSSGVYYNVTSCDEGLTNGVTYENGVDSRLVIQYPGVYHITSQWSFSGGVSTEYHLSIGVNGVQDNKCHAERVIGTGGDVGSASYTCFLRLETNDILTAMIENVDSTTDPTIKDLDFNIKRIGE